MVERVLFLMSDTGGGHRSAAEALAVGLDRAVPGRYDCRMADIMSDGFRWPLSQAGRMYGPIVNRFPYLWGVFWHTTNGPRRARLTLRAMLPLAKVRLRRLLVQTKPAIIVSTHPWANYISVWLLRELGWRVPLVTVITDPVSVHHWWLCPDAELCLVATEGARDQALRAGLAPERVRVVGVPIHPDFSEAGTDRRASLRTLGLAEGVFTILMASGGDGMGQVIPVARALAQGLRNVQLLIVTGRNEGLRRHLKSIRWDVPVCVLGFVSHMPTLMRVADVMVSKAGPSTISEALASGLPILISGHLRGQEEGNTEWVVRHGAGLYTPSPRNVVAALRELARVESGALEALAQGARRAAKPYAGLRAAELIHELCVAECAATGPIGAALG